MAALFEEHPNAVARSKELADSCQVDLDFSDVRFSDFSVPDGQSPFNYLWGLADRGVQWRYGERTPGRWTS